MTVIAILALVALAIWIYLALGHGWFWRTDVELPAASPIKEWPAVAVIVPARDEADVLPATLPALLAQDYPGPYRVLLVDDRSADHTWEIAGRMAASADCELSVLGGTETPDGWAGKLWALQQGLAALRAEPPEFVLFTDADIVHPLDSVRRLVAAAHHGDLDLVSFMALLPAGRRWERFLIPAFVYFFAQLYPFRRVNRRGARAAAAAGGCMLVRLGALSRAGGLERIRGAIIDDVALARLVKGSGGAVWLGLSQEVRSCRPYPRLGDVWQMVARSAFKQLRYSYTLLALTVVGLVLTYLVPPLATVVGAISLSAGGGESSAVALGAGSAAWLIMAGTYIPMLRHHVRPAFEAFLLPLTAALYVLMTLDSAQQHRMGGGALWKGRRYAGRIVR